MSLNWIDILTKVQKDVLSSYENNSLAPDKVEIKREILSEHQLKISDFYNILTGYVKK